MNRRRPHELALVRAFVTLAFGGSGLLACVQLLKALNNKTKDEGRGR